MRGGETQKLEELAHHQGAVWEAKQGEGNTTQTKSDAVAASLETTKIASACKNAYKLPETIEINM